MYRLIFPRPGLELLQFGKTAICSCGAAEGCGYGTSRKGQAGIWCGDLKLGDNGGVKWERVLASNRTKLLTRGVTTPQLPIRARFTSMQGVQFPAG
ncbi:hypothetical protein A0H81_01494 [Grifola frondosa]|uniref:Uncharacterized protein n=1 Tax=Grifola frondosa TaxID=5627 RepID=A0A1C7MSD1_GRIFR|nr:hypothetical protein A0H81_01494 [Grifola frondosa]